MKNRTDKINYYLDIAEVVLERSTCIRRNFGAVVVKNDEIIATGYNGAARGLKNCGDSNTCRREELGLKHGEHYELCRAVHAEANAIISASRAQLIGSTLYLVGKNAATGELEPGINCCIMCKRMVINAGIETVVIRDLEVRRDGEKYENYRVIKVADWLTGSSDTLNDNSREEYADLVNL